MPKGDYANGLLGVAATSPEDRRVLAGDEDFGTAVSASELPPARDTFAARFNPASTNLDWRYELANMDPREKDLLYRNTNAEIEASQGPVARIQHMEGIVNRLHAARTLIDPDTSLSQVISGSIPYRGGNMGGAYYYPTSTKRRMSAGALSDDERAYYDQLFSHVTGNRNAWQQPSNYCAYCTGNESAHVRSGGAPITARAADTAPGGYERYVAENWTLPWYRQMAGMAPTTQVAAGTLPNAPTSGSVARPGSSPTVAEGSEGNAMSSLRNASLAAELLPYFREQEENKAGGAWGSLIGKLAMQAPATTPVDYRSFFHRRQPVAQMQSGGRIWPKIWEAAERFAGRKTQMAVEELGEEAAEQIGTAKKAQPHEGENHLAYGALSSATEDPFERAALRAQAHYRDVPVRPYSATEDWLAENIIPKTPLDYATWAAFGPWGKALSVPLRAGILGIGGALDPKATASDENALGGAVQRTSEGYPYDQSQPPRMQYGGIIKAAAPLATRLMKYIRAYHGSPYDFERFDISKIGTGEGAQAYGHGLYFAENPAVAESYKRTLTGLNPNQLGSGKGQFGVGGNPIPQGISGHAALDTGQEMDLLLGTMKTNPESTMIPYLKQKIEHRIANHYSMTAEGTAGDDMRAMAKYYNDYVKNAEPKDVTSIAPGKMYEVNIRAEPEQFLNWDVPLSQQSSEVQSILANPEALGLKAAGPLGERGWHGYVDPQGRLIGSAKTGGPPSQPFNPAELGMGLYRGAAQDPFAATARLREAGIPGIRYLDQGSRGGGAGTSNYVLFRDDIIDILKKYGIAGGVGGGLAGSSGGEPGNRLDLPHMQYGGVIKAAEPLAARVLRYLGTEAGPEALAIARQYLREPQRVANPGIYKDPRRLAAEAEARVAPEDPAMKQLFGVTRQDLYDISRGGTRPGNLPEMVLPPAVGARGENYAAQRLMTPENAQRQLDAIAEARRSAPGLTQGMVPWYVMDPAYEATERASSKAAAPDLFRRFTGFTGLSSPASPVEWELQRGTAANMMSRLGRWGDWEKYGGMPAEQRPPDIAALLGTTPGHLTHSSVQTPKGRIMHETGQWPQFEDPKVQLYIPSGSAPQIGFQTQWPVPDVHFSGAAGLADVLETATKPKRAMKMGEYKSFAPWWRSTVADPSGMQSTSTQGLQWGLYSPQTGVKTTIGAPKLELFSKEIMRRANELGITPEEVRDKVLRGEERVELPQTAGYA